MIEFENPASFCFLLFIPVFYILRYVKFFSKTAFPLNLSDWGGDDFKWESKSQKILSGFSKLLTVCFFVCLVAAFANPVVHDMQKVYSSKGASIMFVLDVSPSMAARDISENQRITAAKNAISYILESDGGCEAGLVEMAKNAAVVIPPTMDRNLFFARLDALNIGELGDGTAIGVGLSHAVFHLKSSSSPKKCIVLITDGENNAGEIHPLTAASFVRECGINLYVLGIGSKGNVPLEYVDPNTGKVYSGYLASDFDVQSLVQLANEADGVFFEIESLTALRQAITEIEKNETVIQSYHIKNNDTFYFGYFLKAAFFFILIAWIVRRIILREAL